MRKKMTLKQFAVACGFCICAAVTAQTILLLGVGSQYAGAQGGISSIQVLLSTLPWLTVSPGSACGSGACAFTVSATTGEAANQFLATPNGTTGIVGLRAIVAADVPTLNQNTTGTAGNVTGTVAVANGGTGQTTVAAALAALIGGPSAGNYVINCASSISCTVTAAAASATTDTTNASNISSGTLSTGRIPAVNTVVDTSTPITVSTTLASEMHYNENATAGTAVTYNLPTAAAGKQFCVSNANNGSAANTGVLTIATSASGQFIIFTDGTLSATGGNVTSGGAAADAACVTGIDSTHWSLYVQRGTWTKH